MADSVLSENSSTKKPLMLGILSAVFAVNVIDVFVPLLLPEIAQAFQISRGAAASLTAFSAIAGVITGFALSALSIKVKYKSLLSLGVFCAPICILGMFLAPSFVIAQIFYALNGVGSVIVAVMAPTLIAEIYPLKKKAVRISWVVSTAYISILVANPIIGFLTTSGVVASWRNSLLWFLLPVTLTCSILVIFLVPSKTSLQRNQAKKEPFMNGFRDVLANRSACACLSNNFLGGVWMAATIFNASFMADVFGVSPGLRGMIAVIGLGALVSGTLVGGFLVNPIGRKNLLVISAFAAVLLAVLSYAIAIFVPNMWLSVGIRSVSGALGGFVFVAAPNLYLEQVPKYRGTMESLGHGLGGIGRSLGIVIAGLVLSYFTTTALGYTAVIATLAAVGLTGTTILIFFAKDPCRCNPQTSPQPISSN